MWNNYLFKFFPSGALQLLVAEILLQNVLIDIVRRFVLLKNFRRSSFTILASSKLKYLFYNKKTAYNKYKITGSINDYNIFSCLRSQCKAESKLCLRAHIIHSQTRLASNPREFQSFINIKRTTSFISDEVYFDDQTASGPQFANLFTSYFSSTYKNPSICPNTAINYMKINEFHFLSSQLCFSHDEVAGALSSLPNIQPNGLGPDGNSAFFFYTCRKNLCLIFNKS